jgi:hypothetical protein
MRERKKKMKNRKFNWTLPKNFWRNMTIFLAILYVIFFLYIGFFKIFPPKYSANAQVIEVIPNENNYTICFQLENNNHVFCVDTSENYSVGENYVLTFNSHTTISILDDEIVKIERKF